LKDGSAYTRNRKADKAALEAGNGAYIMAKEMPAQVGCEVVIPRPGKVGLIWQTAWRLAELLRVLLRNGTDYEIRKIAGPRDMVTEALGSRARLRRAWSCQGKNIEKVGNSLDINHRSPIPLDAAQTASIQPEC
jgi:hypothetical protein